LHNTTFYLYIFLLYDTLFSKLFSSQCLRNCSRIMDKPTIANISPTLGSTGRGTQVKITGEYFTNVSDVTFGFFIGAK
jgi:hypothetical protein